jgi:sugar phosphate permease
MEDMSKPSGQIFNTPGRPELPNATAILVLGIISIVGCFCYGTVGLICGIIAMVLASKAKKLVEINPDMYSEGSVKNMKAGRTCAIIGLILSALCLLFFIAYLVFFGTVLMSSGEWQELMNR